MAAPSAMAFILPKATARGRYFMPQSGATMIRSAATWGKARRMRSATVWGVSIAISDRSITPRMMSLEGSFSRIARSSFGCAACPEDASDAQTLFRLADEALYDAKRNGTVLRFVARA